MTLHEAIEIVIKEQGKALTSSEISIHINKKKLYQKSGNRPINSSQVSARVNKYPSYFFKEKGLVFLNDGEPPQSKKIIDSSVKKTTELINKGNPTFISYLIENHFEKLGEISTLMQNGLPKMQKLNSCGVYAITIHENYIPKFINYEDARKFGNVIKPWSLKELKNKWVSNAEIVYYGLAGKRSLRSLRKRLNDLIRHGKGLISESGPHSGGEILWQLKHYERFSIWVLPTNDPLAPRNIEEYILQIFFDENKKLPFANRQF